MSSLTRLVQVDARRIVDVVHGTLRRAITRHELEPGFHLSVPALAEQLGVSRSPVREAVQRLISEGLAIEQPRRGAYVTRYDVLELLPLYQVRMVLDGLAAGLAAHRMTPEYVQKIGKVLEADRRSIAEDDLERHIEADIEFHCLMMEGAGNAVLSGMLQKIYDRIRSAMMARVVLTGPGRAYEDHVAIFEAARQGHAEAAEAAARAHVGRVLAEFVGKAGR